MGSSLVFRFLATFFILSLVSVTARSRDDQDQHTRQASQPNWHRTQPQCDRSSGDSHQRNYDGNLKYRQFVQVHGKKNHNLSRSPSQGRNTGFQWSRPHSDSLDRY